MLYSYHDESNSFQSLCFNLTPFSLAHSPWGGVLLKPLPLEKGEMNIPRDFSKIVIPAKAGIQRGWGGVNNYGLSRG